MPTFNRAPAVRHTKGLANVLLIIPAFATMGGLSTGAVWLIQYMQSLRCPAGTFLTGSDQVATILQIVPIFFASIGFGFLAVNWLAHLIPPVRAFFDRNARENGETKYRRSQRTLAKLSLTVLSLTLPIAVAASFSQYYLSKTEIRYQPFPWTRPRHYSWQDVMRIETLCKPGSRGNWQTSFFLIMSDGTSFDIMAWPHATMSAYPEMAHALEGVAFAFSSINVDRDCPDADLLTRRP